MLLKRIFPLFLLFWFVNSPKAHAYLDPGTGSLMIQVAIGGALAALYTLKVYWKKIRNFFKKQNLPET